jgi:hypothetical protein
MSEISGNSLHERIRYLQQEADKKPATPAEKKKVMDMLKSVGPKKGLGVGKKKEDK